MDNNTLVTVITSILTFVGGIVGSYFLWRKNKVEQQSNDAAEFRADLLEFSKTLTSEINELRDRIHKRDAEMLVLHAEVVRLQRYISVLARVLMDKYGIDADDLVKGLTG